MALLPLAMRLAGPQEALWHSLIRKNHGASHFIVGRDHPGPGPRSDGRPFFGPFEAQELVARHSEEIGVEMVSFGELVFLPDEDRYEEASALAPGTRTLGLSGTAVRDKLAKGEELPEWFTRPDVARLLSEASPSRSSTATS